MPGMAEAAGTTAELVALLVDGARYDDAEDLEAAIEAGVDVNATDEHGRTALHMAAANGHVCAVRRLMEAGALLDKGNAAGNTALHWACVNGLKEVVAVLMEGGASPCALNSVERTPVDEALGKQRQDIVDLINEYSTRLAPSAGNTDELPLEGGDEDAGSDGGEVGSDEPMQP